MCIPQPTASFNLSSEVVSIDDPTFSVNNTSEGAVEYVWNFGNGVTDSNFEPTDITYSGNLQPEYQITLIATSENGCVDSTFRIIKVSDELTVYVPNTFIPDGDGLNDIWFPVINGGMYENTYELIIVDRWGEIIFQSKDYTQGWDGTYKGNEVQNGTYSYSIRFRSTFDKQNKLITGHVNLLR
ncbi:MAG: hypothetical protein EBQ94_08800 [Flavobacteriales bacterium]|nr:hypothetical protein [Flavobacteriales bacterium]